MIFSANTLITLLQALQLVALAPCVFVIAFLLLTARSRSQVVVPCLYFAALAACFTLPLLPIWTQIDLHSDTGELLYGSLIFTQSLLPALSFLLIIQFAIGRLPPPFYWAILALPLVGGSGVVYASLLAEELCFVPIGCVASTAVEGLYSTFSNALIFLLLVVLFNRARKAPAQEDFRERNRYWLIVALIGLNLLVMAVELLRISEQMHSTDAIFVITLLRMTFIYVVLTLLFRIFDRSQEQVAAMPPEPEEKKAEQDEKQRELIESFERLMDAHLYREMECSRETVARALGVHENTVSRVINQHYGVRFTDVVNKYRVKEAQRLLVANPEQPVTDIAFEVGFNSIPSFNRVFKENCGFSPSEFRNTRLLARSR